MMRPTIMALVFFFSFIPLCATQTLNVGVYNNSPKIFINDNDKPSGFFVDLLSSIAGEEKWHLNFVPCEWEECLSKLESGEIDIMPDVAQTKEREKRFYFGQEVVLSSWSMVYGQKGNAIFSILDLHNKRVAVLKNSVQYIYLKEQASLFDIHPRFVETENFSDSLGLLEAKKVDVAIINNFYDARNHAIEQTNVFLNPVILKFAFTKTLDSTIKMTIDTYLKKYKHDTNSPFYSAKKKWLEVQQKNGFPAWLKWGFLIVGILVSTLLGLVAFFRYLLGLKIKELKANEKILISQSRSAAMGEMISMIAHQWKQPLSILSMIANNLKADVELGLLDTKTVQDYHQQLSNQIFYLSHTIDDFRNFFKTNKEKQFITDLNQVVENALSLMGKSLENNQIRVIKEFDSIKNLLIYSNELVQVIINLLKNSKEAFGTNHSPKNYILIRIYRQENDAFIEVEDNAGGIKAEILEKIFDPYFTTKEEFNGTGLGLYMSKSIVENHFNGTLSVTCKGKTSLFTIKFPIINEEV